MTYRIIVQQLALSDLQEAFDYAAQRSADDATRWLQRFEQALQTLDERPDRCAWAREQGKVSVDVREFLFGKRPYVFRVIFTIEGENV